MSTISMKTASNRLTSAIAALCLLLVSLGGLLATLSVTVAANDPSRSVAVIFAPWSTPEAVLSRAVEAGARFVRFGGVPFVAIIIPDRADYARRAFASGAWLVVDAQAITACLDLAEREASRE